MSIKTQIYRILETVDDQDPRLRWVLRLCIRLFW